MFDPLMELNCVGAVFRDFSEEKLRKDESKSPVKRTRLKLKVLSTRECIK